MDESILKMHDRTTLKNMAFDKGLSRRGFNGRNASRMRKQDFVDFILFKDHNQRHQDDGSLSPSFEDDLISIFQDLIVEDSIIHLLGSVNRDNSNHTFVFGTDQGSSDNPQRGFGRVGGYPFDDVSDEDEKQPERIPKEEDESTPNLSVQEFENNSCPSDCSCETCQKNNEIKKSNLKVIHDLEIKISCVVCQSNMRNVIFGPCNHLATCISCSKNPLLKKCPLCRKVFKTTTRIFC